METLNEGFLPKKKADMEDALARAGLFCKLSDPLGCKYFFAAEWGSHHQEIAGTIESIRTSDEGPLVLGVSNPTFWGEKLLGLAFVDNRWCAYIDVKDVDARFIAGRLTLL